MGHRISFILVGLLVWLGASVAVAEEPDIGGDEELIDAEDVAEEDIDAHQKMIDLSAKGNEHYSAGEIAEAAKAYAEAFEAYPQPILLKNQMITQYLLDDCEEAIEMGESFLETGSYSEEDMGDVERVFGDCSIQLAESEVDEGDYEGAEEWLDWGEEYRQGERQKARAESLRGRVDTELAMARREAAQREAEEEEASAMVQDGVSEDGRLGQSSGLAWGLIGGGVAAMAGGGLWHLRWESRVSDLEGIENREAFEAEQQRLNDRRGMTRLGISSLYVVGLGAITTGSILLLTGDEKPAEAQSSRWSPVIDGDQVGARVRFDF